MGNSKMYKNMCRKTQFENDAKDVNKMKKEKKE